MWIEVNYCHELSVSHANEIFLESEVCKEL
jgi:hypothetical protein